jgi:low temperature requirement protein LtrA
MSRTRTSETQGVTFVELFFDLVFVYAITQLTSSVLHDLTWAGVARWAPVFWLIWWAWTQFTWTLNVADTEHSRIRLLTVAATAVAFYLAQAVPDAYGDGAVWFAAAYVVVRGLGLAGQFWVIGDDKKQIKGLTRYASASLIGLTIVLAGAFMPAEVRPWVWLAAILADFGAAALGGRETWVLQAGHFAERHGLIVIIALGESLIAAGVATGGLERDLTFSVLTTGAVISTCALWWMYFGTLHQKFEMRMATQEEQDRGRFARDVFSLWHAVVVAGIIGVAVGFEEAIAHPEESLTLAAATALAVGAAMFAGGLGAAGIRARIEGAATPLFGFAAIALASIPLIIRVDAGIALWGLAATAALASILELRFLRAKPGATRTSTA